MSRPTGVTIIAALYIISALILIIEGLALAFLVTGILGLGGGLGLAAGLPVIIIGIIDLIIAWGLLSLKRWARIVAIIFAILSLISGLMGLFSPSLITLVMSLVTVIVNILILWYLFKPEVKSAFQ